MKKEVNPLDYFIRIILPNGQYIALNSYLLPDWRDSISIWTYRIDPKMLNQ